ncbi:M3 family oligoendopeptidase [Clostridium hydrogeniformans]|uniref:M3 family oligoendopeptidase n=1 Tax=Clostridium hydrogeniformans TaxID=349933 RepID=UPI000A02D563|nr:M3 family oligoendopeptidase [Clostridium hydrogeniformans]
MEKLNMTWSLNELYTGFDSKEYKSHMEEVVHIINNMKEFGEKFLTNVDNSVEKIEAFLRYKKDFSNIMGRLYAFSSLSISANSKDNIAKKEMDKIDKLQIEVTTLNVQFTKWINTLEDLDKILEENEEFKEYIFILKEIRNNGRYILSEEEELLIANMSLTGGSAWSDLRNNITANHMVDVNIDDKIQRKSINEVKNMAFSYDKNLRKEAHEGEEKSNEGIEEVIASCLNGIKGEAITLCNIRGYDSPLQKTLIDSRMDEKILDNMLEVMRDGLKHFEKYFLKKAELLGYEGKLPYYERMAPIGESKKEYSYEEAMEFIVKHFNSFSKDMGDLAYRAFSNRWIDSEVREGKRGGAFCSNLHCIKESRILSSYNGSLKNVCTLAHELGHAYHGHVLGSESVLNTRYPMPLAETASIFCETLVRNAALKEASKEEAMAILDAELVNSSMVIVDIYSRFLFEKEVFERRKQGKLSSKEINEIMLWAEKEAYGDAIDESTLDKYAWIHKPHYYFTERHFYNFPYAFGLLFSKGLYNMYLKEGEVFIDKYNSLLRLTGKASIYDVAKFIGIDLYNKDFFKESLDIIIEDINKFLEL